MTADATGNTEQAAPSTVSTTETTGAATTTTAPTTIDFSAQIPEDLRSEPSLSNIKDIGTLAKGYVHAQKELGSRIRIPGPDASPEIKAEFYQKVGSVPGVVKLPDPNNAAEVDAFQRSLGRPATAAEYDIKLAEGLPVDAEAAAQFKDVAFRAGLTKAQVAVLSEFESARTQQLVDNMIQAKEQGATVLKEVWGNEFNNNIGLCKEVLSHYGSKYPDAAKELMNGAAANNPVFLMMASELGKAYKESGIVKGDSSLKYGLEPHEARNRIKEVMGNKSHAYNNPTDPNHENAVLQVEQLYKAAYPSQEG